MAGRGAERSGLVVAPQAEAAFAGARVLEDGGSAADAVVAAALVQGVVDPHRCGIGGFGCATLWLAGEGAPWCVDFHGRVGSRAREDLWLEDFESAAPDGFGFVVKGKTNDVGYRAITVPGTVAGLEAIHARLGRLPWRDLVERAAYRAEDGFLVPAQIADFWRRPGLHGRVSTLDRLRHTQAGRQVALRDGREPYDRGDRYRQPLLAATYRRLASEGPRAFYEGSIARAITADWERHDALVTGADLAAYTAQTGEPLRGRYRGLEVCTSPLPGGGVALLQALRLLEGLDPCELGHNSPDYIDAIAPVLQAVWRDRLAHHGDPAFGAGDATELLSDAWLARLAAEPPAPPPLAGADSPDTTQLTVVDGDGNAVSFSHSLGYGSGVFTDGLGFMYNNCMSAFDPRPGRRNSIAPGKARSTAVAETILIAAGRPRLVLGSPGAARITAGLVETIVDVVDFGMSAAEAVVHPRFDAYGERELVLESRFTREVAREAERRGWHVTHSPHPFGVVGRVYAIELDPGSGRATPGVDPGEPGAACRPRPTRTL